MTKLPWPLKIWKDISSDWMRTGMVMGVVFVTCQETMRDFAPKASAGITKEEVRSIVWDAVGTSNKPMKEDIVQLRGRVDQIYLLLAQKNTDAYLTRHVIERERP